MPGPATDQKAVAAIIHPLLDEAVRHAVDIEAVKAQLVAELRGMWSREIVEKIIDNIAVKLPRIKNRGRLSAVQSQKNVAEMIAVNNEIVSAGIAAIQTKLGLDMLKLAKVEVRQAIQEIKRSVPVVLDFKAPSAQTIRATMQTAPVQGRFVKEWMKEAGDRTKAAVTKEIRIGLAQGKTTEEMTRSLKGTRALGYSDGVLAKPRAQVETIVRTSVNTAVTDARELTYAENSDIISGVKIIAVLDSRTTFICISEDQNVYEVGKGPRPPFHPNCRSTTIPVLDYDKIGFRPAPGKRAALGPDGGTTVSAATSYPEWFARQPAAWQKEVLGPGRYDLYRNGVKLADMKDLGGRRLSIEQIRQRAGLN